MSRKVPAKPRLRIRTWRGEGLGLRRGLGLGWIRADLGSELLDLAVEFVETVEFLADEPHLLAMHAVEHLEHHHHRRLKLIDHLLLHLAEMAEQQGKRGVARCALAGSRGMGGVIIRGCLARGAGLETPGPRSTVEKRRCRGDRREIWSTTPHAGCSGSVGRARCIRIFEVRPDDHLP